MVNARNGSLTYPWCDSMSEPFIRSAGPSYASCAPGFLVDNDDVTFLTASILASGDERNLSERYLTPSWSPTIDALKIPACMAATLSNTPCPFMTSVWLYGKM